MDKNIPTAIGVVGHQIGRVTGKRNETTIGADRGTE